MRIFTRVPPSRFLLSGAFAAHLCTHRLRHPAADTSTAACRTDARNGWPSVSTGRSCSQMWACSARDRNVYEWPRRAAARSGSSSPASLDLILAGAIPIVGLTAHETITAIPGVRQGRGAHHSACGGMGQAVDAGRFLIQGWRTGGRPGRAGRRVSRSAPSRLSRRLCPWGTGR